MYTKAPREVHTEATSNQNSGFNHNISQRTEQLETHYRHTRHRSPGHQEPSYLYLDKTPEVCTPAYGAQRSLYSGRIYPNGEFGIGRVPPPKKRVADSRYDEGEVDDWVIEPTPRTHELEDGTILHDAGDMLDVARTKLGSARELSHQPKKYGLLGITGYGRKCVRNIAYQMEQSQGRYNLQMGTLTIPSLREDQMLAVAKNWGYITSRFFQACKRRYKRFNRKFRYVSVTEIQPQRWANYKEVGLHIHFLFRPYKSTITGEWSMDDNWVRATWRQQILNVLSSDAQVETPNYRRERVHTSAAAYMGKYMSKGSDITAEVLEVKGEDYIPSQWWSADMESKRTLKASIIHVWGTQAETLLKMCKTSARECFYYCSPIVIETPANGNRIVGYYGRLSKHGIALSQYIPLSSALYG